LVKWSYFVSVNIPIVYLPTPAKSEVLILSFLNFYAMVQVDISQLTAECNGWRETLRQYREEFTRDEARLQQVARQALSKEQLQDVEHLHNQFHIQLINIHDLKQSIKTHDRKMNFERVAFNGFVNEDSLKRHESLLDEVQSLEQTLLELRDEFKAFLQRTP
jgi:hypothetical protein